jgi:hypothetical protein
MPQQRVEHTGVGVKSLFGLAPWAADRDSDTDTGSDVGLVGQGRQPLGRSLVQAGQGRTSMPSWR